MLTMKIALILIQKDIVQEDDVFWDVESVELGKLEKANKTEVC